MSRFAPVVSISLLESLERQGAQGDYHLLLAHKVLEESKRWGDFFKRQWGVGKPNPFVIMDNSLIELGRALPTQRIVDAAKIVGADCVVLPDVLGDAATTVAMSKEAQTELAPYIAQGIGTMGVIQGTTLPECMKCAEELVKIGVTYLAIPRVLTRLLGTRVAISYLVGSTFNRRVHFLGFSDNVSDDVAAVHVCPRALGIDSSVPARMGLEDIPLHHIFHYNEKRPDGWLELDENATQRVIENIIAMRRWVGGR